MVYSIRFDIPIIYQNILPSSAFSGFHEFGYSIDNIEPNPPSGFSFTGIEIVNADEIQLSWNTVFVNDFSHYTLYRNGLPEIISDNLP